MLQVHHIVLLFTPLTLPEKKTFGSLAACVDVDLVLLSFIESQRRRPSPQRKKAKFSNTGNPPLAPASASPARRGCSGEERSARARVPELAGETPTRFGRVASSLSSVPIRSIPQQRTHHIHAYTRFHQRWRRTTDSRIADHQPIYIQLTGLIALNRHACIRIQLRHIHTHTCAHAIPPDLLPPDLVRQHLTN